MDFIYDFKISENQFSEPFKIKISLHWIEIIKCITDDLSQIKLLLED